jgi:hypothetical protein
MKIKFKVTPKATIVNTNQQIPEPLEVETGAFSDTKHYSGMSTDYLYSILLYGTRDGRIPARNVLEFVQFYIENNIDRLTAIYVHNIFAGPEVVGHMVGSIINSEHVKLIHGFSSPGNAPSTIKQKGFDNPLIDTGELANQIFYSINGNGRYK